MLNKVHPPRPDWYEEFYASVLDKGMKSYEDEVSTHFGAISLDCGTFKTFHFKCNLCCVVRLQVTSHNCLVT